MIQIVLSIKSFQRRRGINRLKIFYELYVDESFEPFSVSLHHRPSSTYLRWRQFFMIVVWSWYEQIYTFMDIMLFSLKTHKEAFNLMKATDFNDCRWNDLKLQYERLCLRINSCLKYLETVNVCEIEKYV